MRFLSPTHKIAPPAPAEPDEYERGAVAVIVAMLLVVVLGLGALVIDVGMVTQEKSELQSGADAAATALAYDCLTLATSTACSDNETTRAQAQYFVDANTSDGATTVLDLVYDEDDDDVPQVTVYVGTKTGDGSDEIDFALAPVLGTDSTTLQAQATARWGVPDPSDLEPSPFAIGLCEWENATNDGADLDVAVDAVVSLRVEASVPLQCLTEDAVGLIEETNWLLCSLPLTPACPDEEDITGEGLGGFSYLRSDGNCVAEIVDGYGQQEIGINEGLDLPGTLSTLGCLLQDLIATDYLIVPIFDGTTSSSQPGCPSPIDILGIPYCYRIHGYAAFRMAEADNDLLEDLLGLQLGGLTGILGALGINFGGDTIPFLEGRFSSVVLQDYNGGIDPDAPNLGLTTVQLTD